jgi:AmiR/NasT family two-component response regulator
MRLRSEVIGAMNLFASAPGLDTLDTQVAQALADVATIGILQHRAQRQSDAVVTQLQTALDSRVLIEQAKGVMAERLGLSMDEAFSTLRGHARANHRHLSELARAVVTGTDDVTAMAAHPRTRPPTG